MYVAKISFSYAEGEISEHMFERIDSFIAILRQNGQIYGSEHPTVWRKHDVCEYAFVPELDALNPKYYDRYCKSLIDQIRSYGLSGPHYRILDEDEDNDSVCTCSEPSTYIFYKDDSYLSPVRCGACFCAVPLYRLPTIKDGGYEDIVSWESDYNACSRLYLNDTTAQRAITRELRDVQSSLNRQGRLLCATIEELSGIPAYHSLDITLGRERRRAQDRLCPICGEAWLLEKRWHLFGARCDKDRLVAYLNS